MTRSDFENTSPILFTSWRFNEWILNTRLWKRSFFFQTYDAFYLIICARHPACSWCLLCGGFCGLLRMPWFFNPPSFQFKPTTKTAINYMFLYHPRHLPVQNHAKSIPVPLQHLSTIATLQGKTKTRIKNRDTSYRSGFANLYRYKHETSPTCKKKPWSSLWQTLVDPKKR